MQSTKHHLNIALPDGKYARVVCLQPKEERWREQSSTVHIACSEWLEPHWHKAIYTTDDKSFSGQFMPLAMRWLTRTTGYSVARLSVMSSPW